MTRSRPRSPIQLGAEETTEARIWLCIELVMLAVAINGLESLCLPATTKPLSPPITLGYDYNLTLSLRFV